MDYEKARAWVFPDVEGVYTDRDTMLYALGLGLGAHPTDARELRFVTEPALVALPTMAAVVARNRPWLAEVGVHVTDAVHGEQRMAFHRPLPPAGAVVGKSRIGGLVDKGPGRGVLLLVEQEVFDRASGAHLCTSIQTNFIRGAGGFGGPTGPGLEPHPLPARAPDAVSDLATLPQAALLYRLSGDRNPLHSDPEVARAAGFPRPILHGFCTYGMVGWQILARFADFDPARLAELDARFSAAVLPGETLRTEFWCDGPVISFRTRVVERDAVALAHGRARLRG
jgi:acyl dehydratase